MRVMIIGVGEVGQHLARTLSAERHEVTIIDRDEQRVLALQSELDALVVAGNGASPKFLRDHGAATADLVCAVTQSDEVNVIAALSARQLGARQTVARVRDPEYFGADATFARDALGIDFVINPEQATAEDLAQAVLVPGAVHVEHFSGGQVAVAECVLTERSPLLGRPLGERRRGPYRIIGIMRDGRALAADAGHRPKAGDHLLLVAAAADLKAAVAATVGRTRPVHDVVIFGGGRVGIALAARLEQADGLRVLVVERDPDRARAAAERLRRSVVVQEEGLGEDVLLTHGVDRADAFVAAAGDDRANLLAALNAKRAGAELCLAVVSREEYTPLVDALGIDAAVSPRLITAEAILQAIQGGGVEAVHLTFGGSEVLDVRVESGCRAEGRTAEASASMARTRIAAVVRGDRVLFCEDGDTLHAGDHVITFNARRGVVDVPRAFAVA